MKEDVHMLERVLALFISYGIRSVTMEDIARELGISKKTLYTAFDDKDDLIRRVIAFDNSQSRKFYAEINKSDMNAIQEIFQLNSRIHSVRSRYSAAFNYDLKRYYPEIFRVWLQEKRAGMYRMITENLWKGKREGLYRREIKEEAIANLYLVRMEMLEHSDIIQEHASRSYEFMKEIFTYHLHGICNEEGLKFFSRFKKTIENLQD